MYHGGEQKLHNKTYRLTNVKNILVMLSFYFLRRTKKYYKKRRIPVCLFDKSRTQDNVKGHILHEESWLRWIVIEQVKYK